MLAPATEPEGMVGDGDRNRAEQADPSANSTGTLSNSGRKNRSEVRDYFQIIPSVNGEPAKAKCNCCGRELTWGHGTSALHKHLKSCNKKRSAIEETLNPPRYLPSSSALYPTMMGKNNEHCNAFILKKKLEPAP